MIEQVLGVKFKLLKTFLYEHMSLLNNNLLGIGTSYDWFQLSLSLKSSEVLCYYSTYLHAQGSKIGYFPRKLDTSFLKSKQTKEQTIKEWNVLVR